MPTLTLDSVSTYVSTDTSSANLAYRYTLGYSKDNIFWICHDPLTQVAEYCAGAHLLTSITPSVSLQGTLHTLHPVVFGYTALGTTNDHYYDPNQQNLAGTGQYGGQNQWQYLNHYEDLRTGEGANISYAQAYGNMTGTPYTTDSQGNITDDRFDPLYCTNNATNSDPSKQCTGNYAYPDADNWSIQVVTQIQALGTDSSGNTTVATTSYHYALAAIPSSRSPVGCNPITVTGAPQEADCVSDNWSPSYDGTPTPDHDADWEDYYHTELRGFNIVYVTSSSNSLTVDYYFSSDGWWTPTSNGTNYNGGQLYQEDVYQGNVETPSALLRETLTYYSGVGNTPAGNAYSGFNTCHGSLSAIYNPCLQAPLETKTLFYEGNGGSANAPWIDVTYTYDDLGSTGTTFSSTAYHNLIQRVTTGSNLPASVYPLTEKWTYTPDNGTNGNGDVYYDVNKVTHSEIDDASGHVWQCQDTIYDEGSGLTTTPAAGWPTTKTSYSTCGNSSTALNSYTGYDQYGNVVATVDPLGVTNQNWYSTQGCGLTTAPVYLPAAWTAPHETSCTFYDTSHTASLPTVEKNAFGQATNLSYDNTSGAVLTSTTDQNGQVTNYSYAYDANGNATINASAPGETGGYTTRQSENSQCTTSSTLPCYEIDTNTLLYSNAVSRTFYDAQGRAIETRTPGPTPGDDTVVETLYDDQNNTVWKSVPFQVADGSGWIDPTTAKDINNTVPAGTTTFYDALGRAVATRDPNFGSSQEPGISCSSVLTGQYTACTNYSFGQAVGDTNYYTLTTGVDPNGHVSQSFADVAGNTRYTQTNSGVYGGTLTITKQVQAQYNALKKTTSVTTVDEQSQSGQSITSVTTTATYDDLGRQLTLVDPDQGTFTMSYDPDGNVLSATQTSGASSRTLGTNYDLLGRVGCEQTAAPTLNATGACSVGSPLLVNTYDTTTLGTQGTTDFPLGHLTQSVATTYYPDSTSATVTQQYQTDQRGRTTDTQMQLGLPSGWNVTTSLPIYQLAASYNDANQVTTTTATAGTATYSFSPVYDATTGSLQGLSSGTSGSIANLASLAYNEYAQLSGIMLLNGSSTQVASMQYSYDGNLRPTSLTTNWLPGSGNSGEILGSTRAYDNASNVTSTSTFFASVPGQSGSGGSEVQNFCYNEQNRLVWSGNGGTQPGAGNGTCGSGTLSSGLIGAGYTAPYTYTNLGQIWQGPVNGQGAAEQYLYCDSSHPHQLTGIYPTGTTCSNLTGAVYTTGYGAYNNQNYRSYNGVAATLSYDALNRLTEYNAGTSGQEFYLYDASGNRVLKRSISGGSTTLTVYAYSLQELSYTGAGALASQIDYYSVAGHLIGSTNGSSTTYDLTHASQFCCVLRRTVLYLQLSGEASAGEKHSRNTHALGSAYALVYPRML